MRIKDIMKTDLFVLEEEARLKDAADIMKLEMIRHIPVVDKNFKLVGLVTHRSLLSVLARRKENFLIKDIMIKAVEPETPLKGAIDVMIVNKFGCLPIIDNTRKLIGIVTEIDLLKILYENITMPSDFYVTN
jgi:CBS domain-containing protein